MSKQYCFDIENPDDIDFDPEALKRYVRSLYIGRGETKFKKDETPFPFVVIFIPSEDSTCILLNTRGAKKIARIEKLNKGFGPKQLSWRGITLSKPTEFVLGAQTWWEPGEKKKPDQRWISIRQRGPYFTHLMDPYKSVGGKLMYQGRWYSLNPKEEQLAMLYAQRIVSEEDGGSGRPTH